jgi:hypothetical protein
VVDRRRELPELDDVAVPLQHVVDRKPPGREPAIRRVEPVGLRLGLAEHERQVDVDEPHAERTPRRRRGDEVTPRRVAHAEIRLLQALPRRLEPVRRGRVVTHARGEESGGRQADGERPRTNHRRATLPAGYDEGRDLSRAPRVPDDSGELTAPG